jgi:hypothetical protein
MMNVLPLMKTTRLRTHLRKTPVMTMSSSMIVLMTSKRMFQLRMNHRLLVDLGATPTNQTCSSQSKNPASSEELHHTLTSRFRKHPRRKRKMTRRRRTDMVKAMESHQRSIGYLR